jgi:RimJ/RimL family protein N-acetyltransferase
MLRTQRLKLLPWRDEHRAAFAEMHADPEVMADQGGPIDAVRSNAKLDGYIAAYVEHGLSRWAVESPDGYAGSCLAASWITHSNRTLKLVGGSRAEPGATVIPLKARGLHSTTPSFA